MVGKTPFSHLSRIASNMCGLHINCYPKSNHSTTLLLLWPLTPYVKKIKIKEREREREREMREEIER